jgi:Probable cobalt transporter subunit (CbtA)
LRIPSFHEVRGPLAGRDGLVLDGFPAEVLAEFRLYSLMAQALMWLAIGATFGCLSGWTNHGNSRRSSSQPRTVDVGASRAVW